MNTKRHLYAELASRIERLKQNTIREIEELKDFVEKNDLIIVPVELAWFDAKNWIFELDNLNIPTEQQLDENWSASNIDCGYKPEEEFQSSEEDWQSSSSFCPL